MKVKTLMNGMPYCCQQSETTCYAAGLMKMHGIEALPVIDDYEQRTLVGLVTDRDICIQVAASGRSGDSVSVGEVMSEFPLSCFPDDDIDVCESIMEKQQVRQVPVVDEEGRCVGIISLADIALHVPNKHIAHIVASSSSQIDRDKLSVDSKPNDM